MNRIDVKKSPRRLNAFVPFILAGFLLLDVQTSIARDNELPKVDPKILKNPTATDAELLVAALEPSRGVSPELTEVASAIVRLGKPAVPHLMIRLKTTKSWKMQVSTIFVLGQIGRQAIQAADELEEMLGRRLFKTDPRQHIAHHIPAKYGKVVLASMREDVKEVHLYLKSLNYRHHEIIDFASGLITQSEPFANAVRIELRKIIDKYPSKSNAAINATAVLAAIEKSRTSKDKSKSESTKQ